MNDHSSSITQTHTDGNPYKPRKPRFDTSKVIGQKFGRLTVLEDAGTSPGHPRKFRCLCECGKEKDIFWSCLRKGHTLSCGCLSKEHAKKYAPQMQRNRWKNHTEYWVRTSEFGTWANMIQRCTNSNINGYYLYGGRGIKVCERWKTFKNFLEDMGQRPSTQHSIDRIDNDGDYYPENCRWATAKEQQNNTRYNKRITYNGITLTHTQWEGELGFRQGTIGDRLRSGWTIERIIQTPVTLKTGKPILLSHNGKTKSVSGWANEWGITFDTLKKWHFKWGIDLIVCQKLAQIHYEYGKKITLSIALREQTKCICEKDDPPFSRP